MRSIEKPSTRTTFLARSTPSTMSTAAPQESIFSQYVVVKKLLDGTSSGADFATPADRSAHLSKTLAALTALDKAIEASDTFSPNEIIDDVSTASLRYLSVPFMLADFHLSLPVTSYTQRSEHVKAARLLFKRFLDRCDSLLLITEQAKRALSGKAPSDPVAARQQKIDDFRRETAARQQMRALEAKLDAKRQALAAATNEVEAALEADEEAVEAARELRLLEIDGNINKAIAHLRFIEQEEAILNHAETEEALHKERASMGAGGGKYPGLRPPAHSKGAGVGGSDESSSLQKEGTLTGSASTGGAAAGGAGGAGGAGAGEAEPPRPLRVHKIGDRDDAKAPIPEHMQEYLKHVAPAPTRKAGGGRGGGAVITGGGGGAHGHVHGAGCAHGHAHGHAHSHGHDDGSDPYDKPWFRPSSQACDHCGDDDVTKRPQFTQYMLSKVVGGRGQLVPACPIHGNAHPAGQCPGLEQQAGGGGRGGGGMPAGFAADPIAAMVRQSFLLLYDFCLDLNLKNVSSHICSFSIVLDSFAFGPRRGIPRPQPAPDGARRLGPDEAKRRHSSRRPRRCAGVGAAAGGRAASAAGWGRGGG